MLNQHPIFENIPSDVISDLKSVSIKKLFKKGDIIFLREDEIKHIYFVSSGLVKIYTETVGGEESVIDILSEGGMFGDSAIWEKGIIDCSAVAIEDLTLVMLPINKVKELLDSSAEFSKNLLKILLTKQKRRDKELQHMSLQSTSQRIGCFLLGLCESSDLDKIGGRVSLPYDKALIASRLGMKAETFSRSLKKLKEEVNLSVEGGIVHISSIDKLAKYCCNTCSDGFPCGDFGNKKNFK